MIFNKPDPAVHVPVGDIWIPARGLHEDVYVKTDGKEYVRLDSYTVERILKDLGVNVDKGGWASWERDGWNLQGDYVEFHTALRVATSHPKHYRNRIKKDQVKKALLLLKCPYWSKAERKIVLRRCEGCIFSKHWDGYDCLWSAPQLKPLHQIRRGGYSNYVGVETYREYDYGYIAAFLSFKIEEKIRDGLIDDLYNGYNVHEAEDHITFKKHWKLNRHPTKYWITIKGTKGIIRAEESGECYSYEDWQHLKSFLTSKKNTVLKAFAEVCWKAHGEVQPEYHGRWIASRFRNFWEQLK